MQRTVLLLAATLVTAGCGPVKPSGSDTRADAAPPPPLEGTAWVLASLSGQPVTSAAATLRFEGAKAQGSDGCNRYTIPFTSKDAAVDISGPGMSTQMACAPEVMQQAEAYLRALAGARTYRVEAGSLQLVGADGATLATFAPQPATLAGTTWEVIGVNNGKGGVVSIATTQPITMEFTADGQVAGSAGCNRFTGSYTAEGSNVSFGPAAATKKMCADAAVMEQEASFLKALATVSTMEMEGDRLALRAADGAMAISARRSVAQ
jgi:heat shock protein HslJ